MRIRLSYQQKQRLLIVSITGVIVITMLYLYLRRTHFAVIDAYYGTTPVKVRIASPVRYTDCTDGVLWEDMQESIELAENYMINAQLPEGNFVYELDWKTGIYTNDDNDVRQAGGMFGLALAYNNKPSPELATAWKRAREFWQNHSVQSEVGPGRFIEYPNKRKHRPALACTTLVALGYIDFLRTPESHSDLKWYKYKEELDELLAFLIGSMNDHTYFVGSYVKENGLSFREPNPYGNGEFLLCIIKATKYLGYPYGTIAHNAALNGFHEWVDLPLSQNEDPDQTKGYYQWSSMSWYELSTGGRFYTPTQEQAKNYRKWLVKMGYWIINKHKILRRQRNTGYAYEGIIHAHEAAIALGTPEALIAAKVFLDTIHTGICALMKWQVGNRFQNAYIAEAIKKDTKPKYMGGVQNHASESTLRIDTTQHQLHAYILTLKYIC